MRPWLQDPDGDGTYTWSDRPDPRRQLRVQGRARPVAGTRTTAPAARRTAPTCRCPCRTATVVTISLRPRDPRAHDEDRRAAGVRAGPDAGRRRIWVEPRPRRVAGRRCPPGTDPALPRWRLHWSADGGLAVDAEAVTGGSSRRADARPGRAAGGRRSRRTPSSKGYLALRLSTRRPPSDAGEILRGPGRGGDVRRPRAGCSTRPACRSRACSTTSTPARPRRATLRRDVGDRPRRRSRCGRRPRRTVALLAWPPGQRRRAGQRRHARDDAPRRRRRLDRRPVAAVATARGTSTRCDVYAPTTGKVETNLVTDPYSVALTLNSTRSVAVDLDDAGAARRRSGRRSPSARARAARRLDDLRAARPRLLDRRRDASRRRTAAPTSRSPTDGDGTQAPQGARRGRPEHRAPAADLRHRLDRGGPGQAGDAGLRPRVVRAGQRPSSRRASRRSPAPTASTGATTRCHCTAPEGSYASRTADGGGRGWPSSARWSAALHRDGLRVVLDQVVQPHAGLRPGADSRCSTGSCPATTSGSTPTGAVETSTCCQNIATEHAMAREAHGRLGRLVGAQLQGRRLPLRPDGAPHARRTCWPSARRSTR